MPTGYRHCDSRFGFLWLGNSQPAARWHSAGRGPANYFADTPIGAWAEFLRHEGIRDVDDLAGVRRSLWAVDLTHTDFATPDLPRRVLTGDESSYPACQREADRCRALGFAQLEAPAAALLPGGARGWESKPDIVPATAAREGRVWVFYGSLDATGWPCVIDGSPPRDVLPRVRHF